MQPLFQGDIFQRHSFQCGCSWVHSSPIGEAIIGEGALEQLPAVAARLGLGQHALVVSDSVLWDLVGEEAATRWQENGLQVSSHVFARPPLPDEKGLGSVLVAASRDVDFMVALGGGTIADVVRYVATRLEKPYIPAPTAMSMDGFFTDIALLSVGGMKSTFKTDPPASVLADMTVISRAPVHMNGAGLGEMASKLTAVADWYAASLIRGDHFCDEVERLMRQGVEQALGAARGVAQNEPGALQALSEALYKSAVAMYWYGSARPGAGAEHHLTHYWVLRHTQRDLPPGMHGQEVGVGAVLILDLWERLLEVDEESFDVEAAVRSMPNREQWKQEVQEAYGDAAPEVYKAQKDKSFDPEGRRQEIRSILQALPRLRQKLRPFLPGYRELARILQEAGAPFVPAQLEVTREELLDSVLYAKEVRSKYTSLWVADALGLLPEMALALADDAESLARDLGATGT